MHAWSPNCSHVAQSKIVPSEGDPGMNDMNWKFAVYPEIFLLAMGCLVALVDLCDWRECRAPTYWLT